MFHCFLHPSVCVVCLVRRGLDCHLHGQGSCRQEVRRRHSQRRFVEQLSINEQKGAIHETSYGYRFSARLHSQTVRNGDAYSVTHVSFLD